MSRERDPESWRAASEPGPSPPPPVASGGDSGLEHGRPPVRAAAPIRHAIEQLGPYPSLVLLAIPICLVEPLKFVAVAVAGKGHWITGTAMMIGAYAVSLFVVERLFLIVKPKLLELRWFARIWFRFVILRHRVMAPFRRLVAK